MDTTSEAKQRSSPVPAVVATLALLLPPSYVLSIGPAVWLSDRGINPFGIIDVLYLPLEWPAEHIPAFSRAIEWYIMLWQR
jgi:hypothetical protein